jgi:hypothetical protein
MWQGEPRGWLAVPFGTDEVRAQLLGVTGSGAFQQIELALPAVGSAGPLEFVLHPCDLIPPQERRDDAADSPCS